MLTTAVIGIDPGQSGAMALLDSGGFVSVLDWASFREAYKTLWAWRQMFEVRLVALEDVFVRPHDGMRAATTFQQHAGGWAALLEILDVPWRKVKPQQWMKGLVPAKRSERDKPSVPIAERLFPCVQLRGPRGGTLDGRADALLIAYWAAKEAGVCTL